MKRLCIAALLLACLSTNAQAAFFFFIPGSVVSKIGDALSGAEGDSCVTTSAKVGDVIKSATGNTATVKSLSGTSSRCQNPQLPIRALLVFSYSFSSKAGIDVPEDYEQKPLTDMQRYQGFLLKAEQKFTRKGLMVSAIPRTESTDASASARAIEARMKLSLEDAKTSNAEEITINGLPALRFEVAGKNKGIFGPRFTYVVTLLQGSSELIVVNAWAPSKAEQESEKEELRQFAFRVRGLEAADVAVGAPTTTTGVVLSNSTASSPTARTRTLPETAPDVPVKAEVGAPSTASKSPASVADKLRELDRLFKEGILTEAEYNAKKTELLKVF